MSNRLLITEHKRPNGLYDAVCYTSMHKTEVEKQLKEFVSFGPYKIRIRDVKLFKKLQPAIARAMKSVGRIYPDDIWAFYYAEWDIEHPTREELDRWLIECVEESK